MTAATDAFTWWASKMKLALDGEIDGAAPPAIRPGVDVRSLTRFYDGTSKPKGGIVIDLTVAPDGWRVVDTQRGRIRYHVIDDTDIDLRLYTGQVMRNVCKARLQLVYLEMARHPELRSHHRFAASRLDQIVDSGEQ